MLRLATGKFQPTLASRIWHERLPKSSAELHQVTVYQNSDGLIGKEYWRGGVRPDGEVPGLYYPTKGTYSVISVAGISELMPMRRRLGVSHRCCILYGIAPKESGEFCPETDINHRLNCITRSLKYQKFPVGQPAFFFGDIDMHGVDPEILKKLGVDPNDIGSIDRAICKAFPEIGEVERAYDLGNSAALYDKTTGERVKGFGSWRLIFPVDDASKLPNVMALLYSGLWQQGFGYIKRVVDKNELLRLYDRSLIDTLTVSPERVDFSFPYLAGRLRSRAQKSPVASIHHSRQAPARNRQFARHGLEGMA